MSLYNGQIHVKLYSSSASLLVHKTHSRDHRTGQASVKDASLHPACMLLHDSRAGSQMGLRWNKLSMDLTSPHLPWGLAMIMRTWRVSFTCLATSSSTRASGLTRPACMWIRTGLSWQPHLMVWSIALSVDLDFLKSNVLSNTETLKLRRQPCRKDTTSRNRTKW